MTEIIEMVQLLLKIDTRTYQQYEYTLQAASRERPKVEEFINKLFDVTDRHRPLQIGMQKGGAI